MVSIFGDAWSRYQETRRIGSEKAYHFAGFRAVVWSTLAVSSFVVVPILIICSVFHSLSLELRSRDLAVICGVVALEFFIGGVAGTFQMFRWIVIERDYRRAYTGEWFRPRRSMSTRLNQGCEWSTMFTVMCFVSAALTIFGTALTGIMIAVGVYHLTVIVSGSIFSRLFAMAGEQTELSDLDELRRIPSFRVSVLSLLTAAGTFYLASSTSLQFALPALPSIALLAGSLNIAFISTSVLVILVQDRLNSTDHANEYLLSSVIRRLLSVFFTRTSLSEILRRA